MMARHDAVSQRVAIEVRCVLRIRLRTDIDQHINAVLPQQSAEMLGRVIGVANREQRAIGEVQVRHGNDNRRQQDFFAELFAQSRGDCNVLASKHLDSRYTAKSRG